MSNEPPRDPVFLCIVIPEIPCSVCGKSAHGLMRTEPFYSAPCAKVLRIRQRIRARMEKGKG